MKNIIYVVYFSKNITNTVSKMSQRIDTNNIMIVPCRYPRCNHGIVRDPCGRCAGTGRLGPLICSQCGGSGYVGLPRTCPFCNGSGQNYVQKH